VISHSVVVHPFSSGSCNLSLKACHSSLCCCINIDGGSDSSSDTGSDGSSRGSSRGGSDSSSSSSDSSSDGSGSDSSTSIRHS